MAEQQGKVLKTVAMVTVPVELKGLIDKTAKERGIPASQLMRQALADSVGYELPASAAQPQRKYASPEERLAAQKKREKDRRELVKRLLKEYQEGADTESEDDESDEDEETETA